MPKKKNCGDVATAYSKKVGALRTWNWVVAAINATSFVALLIITLVNVGSLLQFPLWTDFGGAIQSLGTMPIAATLLPFPFITASFHVAQALGICNYYKRALVKGVTTHRWVEYSITNGLITWSIFLLSGVGNVYFLVAGLFLNVLMNFFGWLHERVNSKCQVTLTYVFLGFLPYIPLWLTAWVYYVNTASAAPAYFGWAIVGSFLLSLAFVFPLFWRHFSVLPEMEANFQVERMYLLLSVTAKLYLDWTVTIGYLVT